MRFAIIVAFVAFVAAEEENAATRMPVAVSIASYPYLAGLLFSEGTGFFHRCGGSILNYRSVLTSARCVSFQSPNRWRIRVGSNNPNSGGQVYSTNAITWQEFNPSTMANDLAILRASDVIQTNNNVAPGVYAGRVFYIPDNSPVFSLGWGYLGFPEWTPTTYTQLRRHQSSTINRNSCRNHYDNEGMVIEDSMICSGYTQPWQVAPNRIQDKCLGEPGSPLISNNVIVAIRSWATSCDSASAPSVSTLISYNIDWIQENA